jgi:hypothetical protein
MPLLRTTFLPGFPAEHQHATPPGSRFWPPSPLVRPFSPLRRPVCTTVSRRRHLGRVGHPSSSADVSLSVVGFLPFSACLVSGVAVSRWSRQDLIRKGTKGALLGRRFFKQRRFPRRPQLSHGRFWPAGFLQPFTWLTAASPQRCSERCSAARSPAVQGPSRRG